MLARLGAIIRDRRGAKGIREFAKEIGISAATLSRVESGKLPDLMTFRKICAWLAIDPSEILGLQSISSEGESPTERPMTATFHARVGAELSPDAATDLAALIIAAQKELERKMREGRSDVPSWL